MWAEYYSKDEAEVKLAQRTAPKKTSKENQLFTYVHFVHFTGSVHSFTKTSLRTDDWYSKRSSIRKQDCQTQHFMYICGSFCWLQTQFLINWLPGLLYSRMASEGRKPIKCSETHKRLPQVGITVKVLKQILFFLGVRIYNTSKV